MTNFDTARNALETSLNSSGSAMAEHAKWQKSLESQTLKLKASWQSLSQAFLKSDFLKTAFDLVIKLVDGITLLIDKFGVLPTLFTGLTIFKSFGNKGLFKTFDTDLDGFINKVGIANKSFGELISSFKSANTGGFKGFVNGLKSVGDALANPLSQSDLSAIETYNKLIDDGVDGQKAFEKTMNGTSNAAQGLVKSANGGKVALDGMKTASIGAKAGLIGAKVAAVAFNVALTIGISLLIDFAIQAADKLIKTSKELAEEVDELTSKFKEQHGELTRGKSSFQSEAERYAKLSKGVNKLGENVSLTADEYSEYQQIVNSIADQIPSLVSGYDTQGNAILSVKGNVEDLTTAYEKLIHTQNQEILTNAGSIEEDFANTIKDTSGEFTLKNLGTEGHGWLSGLLDGGVLGVVSPKWKNFARTFGNYELKKDTVQNLQGLLNAKNEAEKNDFIKKLKKDEFSSAEIRQALVNANVDIGKFEEPFEALEKTLKNDPAKIKGIIDDYYAQFNEAIEKEKTIAQAKLSEAFDISSTISGLDYGNISESLQAVAYQAVSGLDLEFLAKLQEDGKTVEEWVTRMLNQFNSIGKENNAKIDAAFNLETQFNGGEISYGEYVRGLENAGKFIDRLDLDEEYQNQLKISLGLDEDGFVEEFKRLRNRLASNEYFNVMPSEYKPFLEGLSSEELSVLIDIIPKLEETDYKETIEDIKSALEREMMLQGLTFDLNLEVESVGIEALNTALAESVSGAGLSAESIDALKGRYADLEKQGYDLTTVFEETSHGVRLNRQEFDKLEKAYASQKLTEVNGQLEEMQRTYDQLGEDIRNCTDPVEKAKLFSDRQLLAKRISEAATLATQYQGLTAAYNDWLAAEEAGQERDMYEQILEGFENIGDEISRGWLDDGTIKFLELLTGRTDLVGKSAKELKAIYKGLDKEIENTTYSVRDFFTVDEEGNSTSKGVYNFLDAIGQLEEEAFGGKDVVKRDEDGNIIAFDFKVAGGDKAIADALGISEELVQIMVRAADDAGFVVTMDGTYKQFADLEKEAKAAVNYINELFGEDYSFDFNTTSIDSLKKDLEEAHKILDNKDFWNADGTFNFDAKGATQAMQIVSTLQARLDTLTQEQYGIGLTVEDEEFEEPLEKLQDYGHTIATLNQLELNPKTNAEEIEELNEELNDIAEYFANLDKDKKVKLGFEADDNIDEIKKKIENGEVKIPTVLDIQTNMDKNIETLADLALLNSGLLSSDEEEVIRKKYKVEVETEVEEKGDNSFVGNMLDHDYMYNPSFAWNGGLRENGIGLTTEEYIRQVNIKTIANELGIEAIEGLNIDLKKLDDKTIQVIAEVSGQIDVEKLKNTLALIEPTKVEAIAKAIGQGDVDALKTAINQLEPAHVQAIAEAFGFDDVNQLNGAIMDLDPKTVEAVAEALGITDVESLKTAVNNMQGKTVDAKVNTDGQQEKVNTFQSWIDGLKGKSVIVDLVVKGVDAVKKLLGIGEANGTANVNGTAFSNGTAGRAFKQGDWRTKKTENALVGELGQELVVTGNRWYTVGDNGAEFRTIPKGSIVFNHRQTKELFKNGKVTSGGGRGRALANGTAFVSGIAYSAGSGEGIEPESESSSNGNGSNNSSADDKFEDVIDWIEIILDRVERSIDKFEQQTNNIYKSWSSRNKALDNQISEIGKEIGLQEQAYSRYIQEANSVGLSESYAKKVRNGSISIEDFEGEKDEALVEKIKDYQEW